MERREDEEEMEEDDVEEDEEEAVDEDVKEDEGEGSGEREEDDEGAEIATSDEDEIDDDEGTGLESDELVAAGFSSFSAPPSPLLVVVVPPISWVGATTFLFSNASTST